MKQLRMHMALIYLLLLVTGTVLSLYMPKAENAGAEEPVVIPHDAIRLRILANSDMPADQDLKRLVRDEVNKEITKWVKDLTSKEEARKVISGNQDKIQRIAERVVKQQGEDQAVKVKFGKAEFPTKLYGNYLYQAGTYEAIVITLGAGSGANWWCVLFPPLCFLDFSNGTAVSQSPVEEGNTIKAQEAPSQAAEGKTEEVQIESRREEAESVYTKGGSVNESSPEGESGAPAVESGSALQGADPKAEEPVQSEKAPVYTVEDEEPVKVKFFLVELFSDIFS
ncbi:stage II sporulation protein R [Peribacillus sp. SCS-37]|uniref:stage II sporulation protein R n=1 Tax=Paraperibacillus esterisolvens TaxID=3115296 RepID=UPI003906182B